MAIDDPIRVLISLRKGTQKEAPSDLAARDAFWYPLKHALESGFEKVTESELEGRLEATLGPRLTGLFQDLFESSYSRTEPEIKRPHPPVVFKVKILRYSTLELALYTTLESAAKAFDSLDSFRIFLEAYLPVAFAMTFNEEFAGLMTYDVHIPYSVKKIFAAAQEVGSQVLQEVGSDPGGNGHSGNGASTERRPMRENSRFYWVVATTTLLVPVLLAFAILYMTWRDLGALRLEQNKQFQPIIERQANLLEEDRKRLDQLLDRLFPKPATPLPSVSLNQRKTNAQQTPQVRSLYSGLSKTPRRRRVRRLVHIR